MTVITSKILDEKWDNFQGKLFMNVCNLVSSISPFFVRSMIQKFDDVTFFKELKCKKTCYNFENIEESDRQFD